MYRIIRSAFLISLLTGVPVVAESPDVARQTFLKTWELVEKKFYDQALNGVDVDAVRAEYLEKLEKTPPGNTVDLINQSLGKLNASHTQLFHEDDPLYYELLDVFAHGPRGKRVRKLFDGETPRYFGILARIDAGKIRALVPGGPAELAGLRVGDVIEEADGEAFHPIRSFNNPKPVTLTVKRGDERLPIQVQPKEIQPREAFLQSIDDSAKVLEQDPYKIGYVRMWSYAGEPYQQALTEVLTGKLNETDGLLLDLRGTWGGASPDFAELFLSQTELTMTDRDGENFGIKAPGYSAPIMILVDDTVSSGKELLAYNLQKSGRATIVGSPSRGAVLGGALHLLPHGYALYLAGADVAVDGKRLEGVGVLPDHYLPQEIHFENGQDTLLRTGTGFLVWPLIERDLKNRWHIDQQLRSEKRSSDLDLDNQEWLRTLLENHGWPSREIYQESAQTAWLIAQHADNDLEFQKYCLKVLTEAVEKGRAPAKERAYLQDRVLVNQGLPQIYGTQVTLKDGKLMPKELKEPESVNERRKSVGLPTLEEYLETFPRD